MRSGVRLAAWIPATRATARTSPLLTALLATMADVSGFMYTRPRATARPVGRAPGRGRLRPLDNGLDWVDRADGVDHLGRRHDTVLAPRAVGVERHELDEPHAHALVAAEGGEVDHLVVVDPTHEHAVD